MLEQIQRDLFALGARLADPAKKIAGARDEGGGHRRGYQQARGLDRSRSNRSCRRCAASSWRAGCRAGAALHVSRTICRRAERSIVALGSDAVEPELLIYVNRLSDLLFVMARAANRRAGAPETEW